MSWRFPNHYREGKYKHTGPHDRLVLCAVNTTTDKDRRGGQEKNRKRFVETLAKNGIENHTLSAGEFYDALPCHHFVISPEGNGVDCHRHYEALMAGCIPIVEHHDGIREKYWGCPILFTTDYQEINETYLLQQYEEMKDQLYDFSCLRMDYYSESLQQEIRESGNYWVQRLVGEGEIWYK